MTGGLVLLLTAAVLAWADRGLTFFWDDWLVIVARLPTSNLREAYLTPHFQHFLAVDFALYKAVFAIAGLRHYWPYQLMAGVGHLLVIGLLLEYARRRVAWGLSVVLVLPIAVLGTAWETLLLPFNEQWVYSVAALLAVLLLLDHPSRRRDVAVFVILLLAVATSSFGPIVAAGVFVRILFDAQRWRRIWVAAAPLAFYALWYVSYDIHAPGPGGYRITASPKYLLDTVAGAVGGVLGVPLNAGAVSHHPWLAAPFELLTLALLAMMFVHKRRLTRQIVVLLTMLAMYWVSLTLNRGFAGAPYTSRYIYVGAVLLVLILIEYLHEVVLSSVARGVVVAVACVATVANVGLLVHYADVRRAQSAITAGEIGALQIADNPYLPRDLVVDGTTAPITAADYFGAINRLHSSPAPSAAQLAGASEAARAAADRKLVAAYRLRSIGLSPAVKRLVRSVDRSPVRVRVERWSGGTPRFVNRCLVFTPNSRAPAAITIVASPPGVRIEPLSTRPVTVHLRRFASAFIPAPGGVLTRASWISLPPDPARQRWHLKLTSAAGVRVC